MVECALPAATELLTYNALGGDHGRGGSVLPDARDGGRRFRRQPRRCAGRGTILFTGGGPALHPIGWLPAASLANGRASPRSLALTWHAELAPQNIHFGMVTITGTVTAGTAFDPDRIAEAYRALHPDPPGAFRAEIIFGRS